VSGPAESVVTRRPAAVLLRAGGLPAIALGALVAAGSAFVSWHAAVSVLVGTGLAVIALSAGPALLAMMRSMSPPAAMLLAMVAYGFVVVVLAVLYLQLLTVSWLSGGHVAAGIGVATVAWLTGMIRAVGRLRILTFDDGTQGDGGSGGRVEGGSPASPPEASH
jgi:hypothetical protein